MSPGFIFVEDVHEVLAAGKKEIEAAADARITPAAGALIKQKGLKIRYLSDEPDELVQAEPVAFTETAPEPVESGSGDDLTDEEVEAIVNRVIEKVKRVKPERARRKKTAVSKGRLVDDDLVICRCEEITRGEIKDAVRNGLSTLNGIKRVTRAGMGLCQGQTCQRLVSQILARELGLSPVDVEPTTARAPVRPVPLSVFATG